MFQTTNQKWNAGETEKNMIWWLAKDLVIWSQDSDLGKL